MKNLPQPEGFEDNEGATEGFQPIVSGINAASVAHGEQHVEARVALLNLLWSNSEVVAMFDRWRASTPYGRWAVELHELLMRPISGVDYGSLLDVFKTSGPAAAEEREIRIEADSQEGIERMAKQIRENAERINELTQEAVIDAAFETTDFESITDEAIALVRDQWKLPFLWIAIDLAQGWLWNTGWTAYGQKFTVNLRFDPAPRRIPAPPFETKSFSMVDGESIDEMWQRFSEFHAEMLEDIEARTAAAIPPRLQAGKRSPAGSVTSDVEWWYRHRILGTKVRSLANRDETARRRIGQAIERADKWLGMAARSWRDGTKGDGNDPA